jgi:hypothetical protein
MSWVALFVVLFATPPAEPAPPECRPVFTQKTRKVAYRQCMDSVNGVYFRIPPTWKPEAMEHERSDVWALEFRGTPAAEATSLTLIRKGFDYCASVLGFYKFEGKWSLSSGGLPVGSPVEQQAATWHGLLGSAEIRLHNEHGFAGFSEVERAFATSTTSNFSIIIEVDPAMGRQSIDVLLEHLVFLPLKAP